MSLGESAGKCLESLQALKQGAKKRRPFPRTASTRNLLQYLELSIDSSLLLLQAWITQFNKGKQTNNEETIDSVRQVFGTLQQYIDDAMDALSARLQYQRIILVVFIRKKKKLVLVLMPADSTS